MSDSHLSPHCKRITRSVHQGSLHRQDLELRVQIRIQKQLAKKRKSLQGVRPRRIGKLARMHLLALSRGGKSEQKPQGCCDKRRECQSHAGNAKTKILFQLTYPIGVNHPAYKCAGTQSVDKITAGACSFNEEKQHETQWHVLGKVRMCSHGAQHCRVLGIADCYLKTTPHTQGADAESDKQKCQQCGIKRSDVHERVLLGLTFGLSGRQRQATRLEPLVLRLPEGLCVAVAGDFVFFTPNGPDMQSECKVGKG